MFANCFEDGCCERCVDACGARASDSRRLASRRGPRPRRAQIATALPETRGAALARAGTAPEWDGSAAGRRLYLQLDFGAGCFNKHRMRQQNVPGAAGGKVCACSRGGSTQDGPGQSTSVRGGRRRGLDVSLLWVSTLSCGLGLSHPSRWRGDSAWAPGGIHAGALGSGAQPGLGYNCSVLRHCACLFSRDFLNKAGAQGAGGGPGASPG